jgi:hypothetical protein
MRRQGRPECELADLFTDFKGIQVTLAVVARAVIAGRIDCKTAGRLLVQLQTVSKLLRVYHRDHRGTQREKALTTKVTKEHEGWPQIQADRRRLKAKTSPLINTDNTDLNERGKSMVVEESPLRAFHDEEPRVAVDGKIREFPEELRSMPHCKWEEARAA